MKSLNQFHHCTQIRWSSPSDFFCSARTRAESFWCRNFASGSTAARIRQNVMNDAITNTGIEPNTRRTRYLSTRPTRSQASSSQPAACHRRKLLLDTPLIDVPEHSLDGVVLDWTDDL